MNQSRRIFFISIRDNHGFYFQVPTQYIDLNPDAHTFVRSSWPQCFSVQIQQQYDLFSDAHTFVQLIGSISGCPHVSTFDHRIKTVKPPIRAAAALADPLASERAIVSSRCGEVAFQTDRRARFYSQAQTKLQSKSYVVLETRDVVARLPPEQTQAAYGDVQTEAYYHFIVPEFDSLALQPRRKVNIRVFRRQLEMVCLSYKFFQLQIVEDPIRRE